MRDCQIERKELYQIYLDLPRILNETFEFGLTVPTGVIGRLGRSLAAVLESSNSISKT